MTFLEELARFRPERDTILTIGVFDGVHLGHRHLIGQVVRQAQEQGALSAVVTLHPHPVTVLRPGTEVAYLTSLEERLGLIASLGVNLVVPVTFTLDLSRLTAREFVTLLRQHLRMAGMIVGHDFALGHGREGTPEVLQGLGKDLGFTVEVVSPLDESGTRVSSTAIRVALASGDVALANAFLGRPFTVRGTVIRGANRGRMLGFPTANFAPEADLAIPADGIYATRAHLDRAVYNAATYVGTRPTFEQSERLVEVYLMDFAGDLYGESLRVEWVDRVRGDMKFDSAEALTAQMERDVRQVRAILKAGS